MNPTNRRVRRQALPPDISRKSDHFAPLDEAAPARTSADRSSTSDAEISPAARGAFAKTIAALRLIAGVVLVIGLSSAVAWGARTHVTSSPRFAVRDIDVIGNHHRTIDEIAQRAGLTVGVNIFGIDLDDARAKLLADPWVSDATLARRLPGTILVQVTEREPGALVALGETYLASRGGELFKRLEPGDPVDLPVITGLTSDNFADDSEGMARLVRRAIDLAADYDQAVLASKAPLQEIHVGTDGAMTLLVGKSALALELGDPPFRKKLDQAARVIAELERRGAGTRADAIMLDNEAKPERVVVRMK